MNTETARTNPSVLVLAGGPDAERPISLASGKAVASALQDAGHSVEYIEIDRLTLEDLATMPGDVVFPVLHGVWGEGGTLQTVLKASGRPFVGSGPSTARLAMDKLATKIIAGSVNVRTPDAGVVAVDDPECCLPMPVVVKPVHEGSSVGLMMCDDDEAWRRAHTAVREDRTPGRVYMVEAMIRGRELTAGLVADDGGGFMDLPLVEIVSSTGVYDYEAKYTRGDTRYVVAPDLPEGITDAVRMAAENIARAIGLRHLGRVDFLLDQSNEPWLLEVNTMPGFTGTSLLPKAAGAVGLPMSSLVSRLVGYAAGEPEAAHSSARR